MDNSYQEVKSIIQLYKDEGDFDLLSDDELRLKAYKVAFDLILVPDGNGHTPMSIRECGKYTDQALLEIFDLQPIHGARKNSG